VAGPVNLKTDSAARKKNNVFWANCDASNPVESSGIVGKNFPFDLRIELSIALNTLKRSLLQTFQPFDDRSPFQTFQPFHGVAQD
jgi:hypothetical protein